MTIPDILLDYIILTTILESRDYCHCHFTNEETKKLMKITMTVKADVLDLHS